MKMETLIDKVIEEGRGFQRALVEGRKEERHEEDEHEGKFNRIRLPKVVITALLRSRRYSSQQGRRSNVVHNALEVNKLSPSTTPR